MSSLLRCLFADLQRRGNLAGRLPVEESEENHGPVCFGEFIEGRIK